MSRKEFVDIFSGAGGSSLGFLKAGLKPIGALDIDPIASITYEKNIGISPLIADAFKLRPTALSRKFGSVDVLLGCPPCQGFSSLVTSRKNSEDARNLLVIKYGKMIRALEPSVVVFENVAGIKTKRGRKYFEKFLNELDKLGYRVTWSTINAADYGVPQKRLRVIVIASKISEPSFPPKTHRPPEEAEKNGFKPWKTVRDAISDLPPLRAGESCSKIPNHFAKPLPEKWIKLIRKIPKDGGSRLSVPKKYWLPCHRRNPKKFTDVFGRLWWDKPSVTITTGAWDPSKGRFVHPDQDRGLSLREAARLQSFPDSFTFYGKANHIIKQIGNALPPLLAEVIGKWIRKQML